MNDAPAWLPAFPPPAFVLTTLSDSELTDTLWAWEQGVPGLVARVCRGRKMRTVRGLYDEFAAAYQFPYYFGENANAFDECLSDLSWLPAKAYLACLTHSDEILADEVDHGSFERIMHRLARIAQQWADVGAHDQALGQAPTPFHVLLQTNDGALGGISARLAAAGLTSRPA
jgi:hypothetical protein